MRILLANDGIDDAGGVNTYLRSLCRALEARGHPVAWLHCGTTGRAPVADCWGVGALGFGPAMAYASAWRPDVCFSHNMQPLDVERALIAMAPVVKMMHGYFGTCVSGLKSFAWPSRRPCSRTVGAACLALYLPRHCGHIRLTRMPAQFSWAKDQRSLFSAYRALVVASGHMKREFVANGADPEHVHAIPPFVAQTGRTPRSIKTAAEPVVVFLGRMTASKGGDLLVRAVAEVKATVGRNVSVVMAGDGPERERWTALARRLGVNAAFPGWVEGDAHTRILEAATALAVPSTWPEPFGIVGLEAGSYGVPCIAFDVGGIREWLTDGQNGLLAGDVPAVRPLADAIGRVISDPDLAVRLGEGGRAVAASFSVDRHLASLEPVLARASAAPSPA